MFAIAWVEFDGVEVNYARQEYRNGILEHALATELPKARAVNYISEETPANWDRTQRYAAELAKDEGKVGVVALRCDSLEEAKGAALAKAQKEAGEKWVRVLAQLSDGTTQG